METIDRIDSIKPIAPKQMPKWTSWTVGAIALVVTSGVLMGSQPEVRSRLELWQHRALNRLEAPYRYPFDLSTNRHPNISLTREITHYQQQVQVNPGSGLDLAALAATYLGMARLTGEGSWYLLAEQTARRSLSILPVGNEGATMVLAKIAEARHDFPGALHWSDRFANGREALSVQVTSNLAMGKLVAARQAADRLVDLNLSLNAFMLQAMVQFAQGKDEEVLKSFHHALTVEEPGEVTNSARIRTLLGRFYYERGQLQKAQNLYQEAIAILPNYPPALLNLAQVALRSGNYNRAAGYYQQLQSITHGNSTTWDWAILRGQIRLKQLQGDVAGAETLWSQAETQLRQSLSGANALGHRRDLARLLLERNYPGDRAEAVTLMQAEMKLRQDTDTIVTYAWALSQAGNLPEAQRVIQPAIAIGTRNASLYDQAAQIESALGNSQTAQSYWQRTKAIDPNWNDAARNAVGLGIGLGS